MEIHKEDLLDVEEQLRYLLHIIQGAGISYFLPLLKGSFSSWIWKSLGILVSAHIYLQNCEGIIISFFVCHYILFKNG